MKQKEHKLFPENPLMPNIIIHNQGKDRLATIDPNGELHLYAFDPNQQEVKHISYLHVFNEEIPTTANWAQSLAGGKIIIGGSFGSILIVDVIETNGSMIVSFSFKVQNQGIVDIKWANTKRQFIATTTKGSLLYGALHNQKWEVNCSPLNSVPIYAAWQPTDKFIVVGNGQNLAQISFNPLRIKKETILSSDPLDSNLKGILWSPSLPASLSTVVLLTQNFITFCSYNSTRQQIQMVWEQKLKKGEIEEIGWGETYEQVVGYGKQENRNKNRFVQLLNGKWKRRI